MKYVKCNLCGSEKNAELLVINNYRIVKCCVCGLTYVNPKADAGELQQLYESYYTGSGSCVLEAPVCCNQGSMRFFSRLLRDCKRLCPTGKILDIGCGGGFFLNMAREAGYSPFGLERSKAACDFAAETLGLQVFWGTLQEARFPEASFDIVTILNVLEHVEDPHDTLLLVNRLLRPEGLLVVTVPNLLFGLPALHLFRWLGKQRMLQIKNDYLLRISVFHVPWHLYLFTPYTLRALLIASNFTDVKIRNAVPVSNPGSTLRTVQKEVIYQASNSISSLSLGKLLMSYSITALARKGERD